MKYVVRPYHYAYGVAWQIEVFEGEDLVFARRGITEREAHAIKRELKKSFS